MFVYGKLSALCLATYVPCYFRVYLWVINDFNFSFLWKPRKVNPRHKTREEDAQLKSVTSLIFLSKLILQKHKVPPFKT